MATAFNIILIQTFEAYVHTFKGKQKINKKRYRKE